MACLLPSYRTHSFIAFSCACKCKFKYRRTQNLVTRGPFSLGIRTLQHTHTSGHQMMWCQWMYRSQGPSDLLLTYFISHRCFISIVPLICQAFGWFTTPNNMCWVFYSCKMELMQTYFYSQNTFITHFILFTRSFKPIFWHAPAPHVALIGGGPPMQIWLCFHQSPACDIGHLWLSCKPTTSKAFSYPSGLTDGKRWILVSSTRWRIRWLPDRYSRHMNCVRRRSSSRPSTSLPWEPAV